MTHGLMTVSELANHLKAELRTLMPLSTRSILSRVKLASLMSL